MKSLLKSLLLAAIVIMLSFLATVSYAGNHQPDTPIPKMEKFISIDELSIDATTVTILNYEASPDVGDHSNIMVKKTVQQSKAEATYTDYPIKRPERVLAGYYGYLNRSLTNRIQNKIRPPNRE